MICCMRVFKFISIIALLLWSIASTAPLWMVIGTPLEHDAFFMRQIFDLDNYSKERRLLVYGSSGMLLGFSASSFKKITGHEAVNLSTSGLGGQVEKAILLINERAKSDDIVMIGDRLYRHNNAPLDKGIEFLEKPTRWFKLVPNLVIYFFPFKFLRTEVGDLAEYPVTRFGVGKYDIDPEYNSANIDIMRRQAAEIMRAGRCPVFVLIPLLVRNSDLTKFNDATSKLFELADAAGLSGNLVHVPAIETDRSLFTDQWHMSAIGRDKWTNAIAQEMIERNICSLVSTSSQNGNH